MLVVGPDGAGKTTLLDEVQRQLGKPIVRAHSRPGLITPRRASNVTATDPQGQEPRGRFISTLKLLLFLADTIIGTLTRWRPIARRGVLFVERGWYDLAVDPRRYRLPGGLASSVVVLGCAVPKADLTILLTGDAHELHRRKPEIGPVEVERQLIEWQRLAPRSGRRHLVLETVDQPIEAVAAAVIRSLSPGHRWRRVPFAPHRLGFRATGSSPALRIYRPQRRIGQLLTKLNAPLLHARIALPAPEPPIPWFDQLVERGPRTAVEMAAFRSSAPNRWIIGVADAASMHTVVKVGHNDVGLERESATLSHLRSTAEVLLPTAVWEHREAGWHALALEALPVDDDPPPLDRVADLTTLFVKGDLGAPIVHGDLAPWNISVDGGRLVVWDWEEAELGARRPLHDLTHYLVRSGSLLGRYSPADCARLLTAATGPGARHLAALGAPTADAEAMVNQYLACTQAATNADYGFRAALSDVLSQR